MNNYRVVIADIDEKDSWYCLLKELIGVHGLFYTDYVRKGGYYSGRFVLDKPIIVDGEKIMSFYFFKLQIFLEGVQYIEDGK